MNRIFNSTLVVGLALLTIGLAIIYPVYAQNNQGRIEGHVTNLTTGGPPAEPLPSVEILINEWMSLYSGRDGEWNITGLAPGVYAVRLNLPPGYSPAQDVITTTIWGDNTEVVDLAFYEGDAPLPTPATTPAVADADSRITPLGSTPTAEAVAAAAVDTNGETDSAAVEEVAVSDAAPAAMNASDAAADAAGETASDAAEAAAVDAGETASDAATTTERPAQAGSRSGSYPTALLIFMAGTGLIIAAAGLRQLWADIRRW